MTDADCLICSMETSSPTMRVFRDEYWAAEVAPGYEVPGWFFLRARRHAEKLSGLNDDEVATFGRHAHDLVTAVETATAAPAVYLLHFGESYPHFHALVAARGQEIPAARRGGALLQLLADGKDPDGAATLVPQVRAAYDQILRNRQPAPTAPNKD